jgi:hypothetical protein
MHSSTRQRGASTEYWRNSSEYVPSRVADGECLIEDALKTDILTLAGRHIGLEKGREVARVNAKEMGNLQPLIQLRE